MAPTFILCLKKRDAVSFSVVRSIAKWNSLDICKLVQHKDPAVWRHLQLMHEFVDFGDYVRESISTFDFECLNFCIVCVSKLSAALPNGKHTAVSQTDLVAHHPFDDPLDIFRQRAASTKIYVGGGCNVVCRMARLKTWC